jgi:hypothetical protein
MYAKTKGTVIVTIPISFYHIVCREYFTVQSKPAKILHFSSAKELQIGITGI